VTTRKEWIGGARPRTLPAAVIPVAVGAAVAYFLTSAARTGSVFGWTAQADIPQGVLSHVDRFGSIGPLGFAVRTVLALIVSLAMQIGVNYANDYSDGIRGTDDSRVGPIRLVGQGLAEPAAVKRAAFLSFGVGALAGLALIAMTGAWWLLIVGLACVAAAWFYTGGSKPYGYIGLGEVMVFLFFGVVAVVGTTFVLTDGIRLLALIFSVPVGLLACALLVINNLRDIPSDSVAGKKTLAVRLGDAKTRQLYGWCLALPFLIAGVVGLLGMGFIDWLPGGALLALVPAPFAAIPWRRVVAGETGPALVPVLAATGKVQLAYGLLLALGIALSA